MKNSRKMPFKVAFKSNSGGWSFVAGGWNYAWAKFIVELTQNNPSWKKDTLAIFEKNKKNPIAIFPPVKEKKGS